MDQDALISVIVPVYNVEAYLARCVDSILAQSHENLEIILVDDGTKDSSGAICDAYAQKDARVRVIHKENGGLSSARNAGIEAAKGEYLAFVDSDDWIEPEMYRHMLSLAKKYDTKLVCCGRYAVSQRTGGKKIGLCPPKEEQITAEEMVSRMFTWNGCDSSAWDKLYHHSLFQEFRYPVGKVCEDVPVTYRIVLRAGYVAMDDQPFYNYFHRAGSITYSNISEKNFHFAEHTAFIYPYIRENYPAIEKQARYLRVRSLVYSVQSVDLAGKDAWAKYARQCAGARKELRKHIPFLLTSRLFGKKERLTDLLLACNLYRLLRLLRG